MTRRYLVDRFDRDQRRARIRHEFWGVLGAVCIIASGFAIYAALLVLTGQW